MMLKDSVEESTYKAVRKMLWKKKAREKEQMFTHSCLDNCSRLSTRKGGTEGGLSTSFTKIENFNCLEKYIQILEFIREYFL